MKLDVVIYLLKQADDGLARLETRLNGLGYEQLSATVGPQLATPMLFWSKQNEETTPDWVGWCATIFDIQNAPRTLTYGAVLALSTPQRTFAVTFGNGWSAIPKELIEPDFGLRVAMHLVPPNSIRSLVTKSVRLRGNETNVFNSAGADLGAFPLEPESEWLRQAGGRVNEGEGFISVRGGASVRLVCFERGIEALPQTCDRLFQLFQAAIPEAFKFYEHLRPVSTHDPKHDQLEQVLRRDIARLQCDKMTLVVDRDVAEKANTITIKHKHKSHQIQDLFDADIWKGIRALKNDIANFDVERLRLHIKDEHGDYVLKGSLIDYLQAEVTDADGIWLRMEGNWFRAANDYVALVDRQLAAEVKDVTDELVLPVWDRAVHAKELDYNRFTAAQKAYLLQDQDLVRAGGHPAIESCDLLSQEGHFIHLKDSVGSQCVGALVSQLRAAAYMMKNHEAFREEMRQRYLAHVGVDQLLNLDSMFVLALVRKANLPLYGNMLVAKINILDCARRVRSLGYRFGVCRVDHPVPARAPRGARTGRKGRAK